jgi:integrase
MHIVQQLLKPGPAPMFGPPKTGRPRTDLRRPTEQIGQPLQINNLGQREYAAILKAAGVKRIKFHGLRPTCATLLLQAGTPVHVVSERLGHSKVQMTLEIYAHVLPDMQREAAETIGAILSGNSSLASR